MGELFTGTYPVDNKIPSLALRALVADGFAVLAAGTALAKVADLVVAALAVAGLRLIGVLGAPSLAVQNVALLAFGMRCTAHIER